MNIVVEWVAEDENIPYDLPLLADPSEEAVNEYMERGQCLVARMDGEIVGVAVLIPTRPGTVEIVNIAVQEPLQGRGIGKLLIRRAIEAAREQGVRTIEIGTGNSSIHQLLLYQKCGFRMTGIDRDFFVRHYSEPIMENGIACRDMIRLSMDLE